jgi:outer membrane beta-barrel protein
MGFREWTLIFYKYLIFKDVFRPDFRFNGFMVKRNSLILAAVWCVLFASPLANAQSESAVPVKKPETVDLKKVSQKYISTQYEVELDVIQNRQFSKVNRFEITALGVSVSSDPFLSTYAAGAALGYHFTEYFGARAVYWQDFSSNNSAYNGFKESNPGLDVNTVKPKSYMGAEVKFSPFYGKMSFLKKSIFYYDFYALAGGGIRKLEFNSTFTPMLGIGQQIFFNKYFSIFLDYRVMTYKQVVQDKLSTSATYGQQIGTKSPFVGNLSLGLSFLI